ncbi:MAG: hypothetical protein IT177_11630 [Acidobacteria bacterium]|nr:hypothetical protein [Acidobacteriota bacterium]
MANHQALADGVLAIVKAATEPLFERIKALEREIAAVKAQQQAADPAAVAKAMQDRLQQRGRTS